MDKVVKELIKKWGVVKILGWLSEALRNMDGRAERDLSQDIDDAVRRYQKNK
jgi:hypothetical protein